jgi:hypothetical protein
MKRSMTSENCRTPSRLGKRPYLYAHGRYPAGQSTSTTSTSSPTTKTLMKARGQTEHMPSHWRQVVA